MKEEIRTVGILASERKLDGTLRIRMVVLFIVALLCGTALVFDVVSYKLSAVLLFSFASGGFLFGLFVLSKISPVVWHEEREVVALKRIDIVGIILLVIYVGVRAMAKTFVDEYFNNIVVVSGITYSAFFGLMVGRLFGLCITIHKIHKGRVEVIGK